jgi:sporulation protein YunB
MIGSLIIGMLIIESRITPIVEYMGITKVKQMAAQTIYDSISDYLVQNDITYDELASIDKDGQGKVTAVKTNIVMINRMEAEISAQILEKLKAFNESQMTIPLGNILNSEFLLGRGPKIKIKINPIGAIDSNLVNEFITAGINQTMHKIQMDITLTVGIILPGSYKETQVHSTVNIAEMVIVGDIPNSYTHVTGDNDSLIGKINDYGSE